MYVHACVCVHVCVWMSEVTRMCEQFTHPPLVNSSNALSARDLQQSKRCSSPVNSLVILLQQNALKIQYAELNLIQYG